MTDLPPTAPEGAMSPAPDVPAPDADALAAQAHTVMAALANDPRVRRVPVAGAAVFAVAGFAAADECAALVTMIDACAQPSLLYDEPYEAGFRTSFSANLDRFDPLVAAIDARICTLTGIGAECGETLQGQRYLPGQEFKPHHDWFHAERDYWPGEIARGGQRSWTAMLYLNRVEEGGATHFTELTLEVPPQPGVLLLWNNMHEDGTPNPHTLHAGTPVRRGSKYVVTKWFRSRVWS